VYETFHKCSHRVVPQNRRTDNRPDPIFSRKPPPRGESRSRSFDRGFGISRQRIPPRPGMAKLATFSLASATMLPGIETCMRGCVCARIHIQSRPNDIRHYRMDNNVCFSPIGGCSSLLTLRDSTYRAVLSARTFVPADTRTRVRARARSPTHPSPTEEEEPPHKCQGPAAEHFLSSISVNKRCRVQ